MSFSSRDSTINRYSFEKDPSTPHRHPQSTGLICLPYSSGDVGSLEVFKTSPHLLSNEVFVRHSMPKTRAPSRSTWSCGCLLHSPPKLPASDFLHMVSTLMSLQHQCCCKDTSQRKEWSSHQVVPSNVFVINFLPKVADYSIVCSTVTHGQC